MTEKLFGDFDIPSMNSPFGGNFESRIMSEHRSSTSGDEDDKKEVSEEEKKRIRNTAAARRCREKIRKRTEELESELRDLNYFNSIKHRQRIILLTQIRQQIETLKHIVRIDPARYDTASRDSVIIVNDYVQSVRNQRRRIDEEFFRKEAY